MKFARRLDLVPPYLFAELERKIEEKQKAGIDVISLGIGDPDLRRPPPSSRRCSGRWRGRKRINTRRTEASPLSAKRSPSFYEARFGVEVDPEREVHPRAGRQGRGRAHRARLPRAG